MKDVDQDTNITKTEIFSMKHPVFSADFWHLYKVALKWADDNGKDTSYDDWCLVQGDEEYIHIVVRHK
jgi:hypothetical protein